MPRTAITFLIMALMVHASPSFADTFEIAGRHLALEPPEGFCFIDETRPKEKGLARYIEKSLGETQKLVAVFIDCKQLNRFRHSPPISPNRMGHFGVSSKGNKINTVDPKDAHKVFDSVSKAIGNYDKYEEAVRERVSTMLPDIKSFNIEPVQLIKRTDRYLIMEVMRSFTEEREITEDTISGLTIVKELILSVTLKQTSPTETTRAHDFKLIEETVGSLLISNQE